MSRRFLSDDERELIRVHLGLPLDPSHARNLRVILAIDRGSTCFAQAVARDYPLILCYTALGVWLDSRNPALLHPERIEAELARFDDDGRVVRPPGSEPPPRDHDPATTELLQQAAAVLRGFDGRLDPGPLFEPLPPALSREEFEANARLVLGETPSTEPTPLP